MVLEGDYTGPAGAWRVLREPGLDIAVLETARGGILLRGMACQSNDVSVMINVTGDHLGLHGVQTVEGLAEVKGVVLRTTRPDGWVVLNADDPLVRAQAAGLRAPIIWVTQDPDNPMVVAHAAPAGAPSSSRTERLASPGARTTRTLPTITECRSPSRAGAHMIENALCAAGATLALGIEREEVGARVCAASALDPADNPGRLHVYDLNGATVILDYAHNEVGLTHLLAIARTYLAEGRTPDDDHRHGRAIVPTRRCARLAASRPSRATSSSSKRPTATCVAAPASTR